MQVEHTMVQLDVDCQDHRSLSKYRELGTERPCERGGPDVKSLCFSSSQLWGYVLTPLAPRSGSRQLKIERHKCNGFTKLQPRYALVLDGGEVGIPEWQD